MKANKFSNLTDMKEFIHKVSGEEEIQVTGDQDQLCSASIANLCLRWSEFNSIKHKIDGNEFSFVRIKHVTPPILTQLTILISE